MRYTLGHQNLRLCLRTVPRFLREAQWVSEANCFSTRSGRGKMGAPLRERKMVDKIRVWAKGGPGGNGCFSIRRSRADWRGKPDGGNGGRGGDVILECSDAVWDLKNLQHHLNTKKGGHGMPKRMIGSRGADKIVQVPVGTVIHLVKGELPSSVDDSNTPLYPWEILDATKVEKPTSDSHSNDLQPGQQSAKCSKDSSCPKLLGENPAEGVSSLIDSQSTRQDALTSIEVNEADTHDDENVEESSEEELEQEEIVQYNVAELMRPNQRITIASGGKGGLGNAYFDKAPTDLKNSKKWEASAGCEPKDADRLEFDSSESAVKDMNDDESSLTTGFPGAETILILELKSIADVGLVGMPNVGKSTLLGAISRAKPIVGNYAFTTLRPNLGRLNYTDFSMTVADIPGIIKGAHENRGLGLAFLRHIERTKVLAYVVDLASGLDGNKGIPPWEQLRDLVLELEHYQEGLSKRPSLVVANKIDEEGAEEVFRELKRRVKGVPIFPMCAVLGEGVLELKDGLRGLVDENELHTLAIENILED